MVYTELPVEKLRKLEHRKIDPSCQVEWVFPFFGTPVFTFDRKVYYSGYADRDELTDEQYEIIVKEGALGCPLFSPRH